MAEWGNGSSAGTGLPPLLKQSGKPPDDPVYEISGSWRLCFKNIKFEDFSRLIIWILYLTFITISQMLGHWSGYDRSATGLPGNLAVGLPQPLGSWSQFTIYSKVLADGRA